jgi:CelD/BcsL family acetyltransferase involved in cellulose biosynthesis
LTDAPRLATGPAGLAAASLGGGAVAGRRPFAHCEVFEDLAGAREAWAELEALEVASPYQNYHFLDAWVRTTGRARHIEPMIVVARDEARRVTAVLPLGRLRRGPVWSAEFLGGRDANFKMGLFRPSVETNREAIVDLLRRAARMTRPPVDAFWLTGQPFAWEGAGNPMAALPRWTSPNFGHKSALNRDFDVWLAAHYSKDARKKLRKKARRLDEIGHLEPVVAKDEASARKILAAFQSQKEARTRALGSANAYEGPHTARFFEIAATQGLALGTPTIELHALTSGEKIVATFGGLAQNNRFCGMFISFDTDAEISRCSPGQLLILETVRDLAARGFATFDLGAGEADYKEACCDAEEPLFDSAVAVTAMGAGFGAVAIANGRIKRWIKHTPWAWRLAEKLRRQAVRLRRG